MIHSKYHYLVSEASDGSEERTPLYTNGLPVLKKYQESQETLQRIHLLS